MDLFRLLMDNKQFFLIDDVEDKKTKILLGEINTQLDSILSKFDDINSFLDSQLNGDYHTKIVKAKSLQNHYNNWNPIKVACDNLEKEEKHQIDKFISFKNHLINNLKTLLKDSQRLPVVSLFDVINSEFVFVKKGHNVIILGNNNKIVIEHLIKELEEKLIVSETFSRVLPIELTANYNNVQKNVEICNSKINNLFVNKTSKAQKLFNIVNAMEIAGKNLTFFVTFKEDLKSVGCNTKEIDLFEKDLLKKYVPLKKQLSKILKVQFIDVCDIVVDEEEFNSNNEDIHFTDFDLDNE